MNIRSLPDKWREESGCDLFDVFFAVSIRADELEAALPKWTKTTDNPDTWPPRKTWVMITDYGFIGANHVRIRKNPITDNGRWWRPLCDLDCPPGQS